MAGIVSFGSSPERIWMVSNSTYEWFVDIALRRLHDDAIAHECLQMAVYVNGISLDRLLEEDSSLARRVARALHGAAADIARGAYSDTAQDATGNGSNPVTQQRLAALVELFDVYGGPLLANG